VSGESVCVYVCGLQVCVWVARERSLLARQAFGRAMLAGDGRKLSLDEATTTASASAGAS
jgi:hypothetical protein